MQNGRPRPLLLCVLDGFGLREASPDNAITQARLPHWERLWEGCPHTTLSASGLDVGLPAGQMGNSEVGHMNIGAGRVVMQDLPMIDHEIASGGMAGNAQLLAFLDALKASGGTCHLMGLASPGGVHSHQNHMVALARLVAQAGVPVAFHAFLDGRDVPPQSAAEQIGQIEDALKAIHGAGLATVVGRYYAMDRDKRWDRVEKAYNLLVCGEGARVPSAVDAIESSYVDGIYDEFVLPIAMENYKGMNDGDGVLFANFRADRAREILYALLDPAFDGFKRKKGVRFAAACGMVEYSEPLARLMTTLYPPKAIKDSLGEVIAQAGLRQMRMAETEKYPHVTFFFNGGREQPYEGEDRAMVASPKVATYDLQPEMSAPELADRAVEAIESGRYDLIVMNFANPDMVGHTGRLEAAMAAVRAVDACLGRVLAALEKVGGVALVTADHGNCEQMYDPETDGPHTAHTTSRVPLVCVGAKAVSALRDGRLADIAPTVLDLMGLPKPAAMTGESLIERA